MSKTEQSVTLEKLCNSKNSEKLGKVKKFAY